MFMSNFTRGGSGVKFWQAVSNLSCCSVDLITKQLKSVKAFAFIALFAFSIGSAFAQTANRSVFFDRCIDDRPVPSFDVSDFEMIFQNECEGSELTLDITENLQGDDCNWQVIYSYNISCGDYSTTTKEFFEGGDRTAPELIGEIPDGQADLNLCFDAIPAGPSIEDIALLFADECSDVTVVKTGEPTGDDCEWSVIYSYSVFDACGNQYGEDIRIEYSGGDTAVPELKKGAVIPAGNMDSDFCFLEKEQGPSEEDIAALFEDNCGAINVVKTSYSKGTDCKWMAEYTYIVSDDCGNAAAPIVIIYQGRDDEAPVLNGVPADITVNCIDALPEVGKNSVTAIDNCDSKVDIELVEDTSQLGLACEGGIVIRTWTAVDNCGNTVSESQTITVTPAPKAEFDEIIDFSISCEELGQFQAPFLGYSNDVSAGACIINGEVQGTFEPFTENCGSFVVSFEFIDECERVSTASVTVTVVDETAPLLSIPVNETVECDSIPELGTASATDNCDTDVTIEYLGEERVDGECQDSYTLNRTWKATDNCDNSTTLTQVITVVDTTAPQLTIPTDETVECDSIPEVGLASATDNCDLDVDVIYIGEERLQGECEDSYQLVRSWTATDNCGNKTSLSQTITVQDTTAPELTIPADIEVECDSVPKEGEATATDNCDLDVSVIYNGEERVDGECENSYQLIRSWTATDNCGNSTTLNQTVTVVDTTAPKLTVPADETVECDSIPELGEVSATDNCDEQVLIEFVDEKRVDGDCVNSYQLIRTWSATDNCGNSVQNSQTISVIDTTAPELIVPADETVECDSIPGVGEASATDNCDENPSVEYAGESRVDGECPNSYTLFRVWIATDDCGNQVSKTQEITVVDTTAPVITAPADITVECDAIPEPGMAEATDNCDEAPFVEFIDEKIEPGNCKNSFVLIRTWRATDSCGNTALDSQAIIVVDTTAPEFNEELPANATVECDSVPEAAVLTATDNCAPSVNVNFSEKRTDGDCAYNYTLVRTWTVSDDCGNETVHTQTITVQDITAPTFTAPSDIEIFTDANCEFDASVLVTGDVMDEADNCTTELEATYADSVVDGACEGSKIITRTWSLIDECGNAAANQVQIITVTDNIAPTFTAPADIEIFTDADCAYDASVGATGDVMDEADNCTTELEATYTDSVVDGACEGSKVITRTWSLVDDCGNKALDQVQIITVTDNIAPTFTAPADIEIFTDANCEFDSSVLVTGDVMDEADNCTTELEATYTDSVVDGACEGSKVITRTWSLVDDCGNKALDQVQIITVTDNIAPTFTAPADIEIFTDANCEFDSSVLVTGDVMDEADNCTTELEATYADSVVDGACEGSKVITRTWSLVDDCGNKAEDQVQIITVTDNIAPTFTAPADIEIFTDANCEFDSSVLVTGDVMDEADNCTTELEATYTDSVVDGACEGSKVITRTWSLVDDCGNKALDQVQIITVTDNIAPTFTAPADIEIFTDANCEFDSSVLVTGDVMDEADNCTTELEATYADSVVDGACEGSKVITRTWSLVDDCGNKAEDQVQIITVTDNIAPTFTAPADIEIFTDANCEFDSSVLVTGDVMDEADNCTTELEATYTDSVVDGACEGSKVITRTWSLVDDCGNKALDQVQIITVSDNIAPTFTAPADIEIFTDADCAYDASVGATGDVMDEADNCTTELEATYTDSVVDGACEGSKVITRTWSLVDDCGNKAEDQVQIITVTDNIAPTFTAPIDATIECDENISDLTLTGDVIDEADNCSTNLEATYQDSEPIPGDCIGNYTVERTWSLVDNCGNKALDQVQIITVQDTTAPTLEGELPPTYVNGINECKPEDAMSYGVSAAEVAALFVDNCGEVVVTKTVKSFVGTDCSWALMFGFTVADDCGNEYGSFKVSYAGGDTSAPTLVEGAMIPASQDGFQCQSEAPDAPKLAIIEGLFEDNCGSVIVTPLEPVATEGDCDWSIEYRFTVEDACGNAADDVVIIYSGSDTIAPTLTGEVPSGNNLLNLCFSETLEGLGEPTEEEVAALYSDNCDDNLTVTKVRTNYFDEGQEDCNWQVWFRYTVADACGNEAEPFKVIYQGGDIEAPMVSTQVGNLDATLECSDSAGLEAALALVPAATDNCTETPTLNVVSDVTTDDAECADAYVRVRTWNFSDSCGNTSANFVQTITVQDTTAPEFTVFPEDITIQCSEVGDLSLFDIFDYLNANQIPFPEAADNCSEVTLTFTPDLVIEGQECPIVAVCTKTFIIEDACGNSTERTFTVTIIDTEAPVWNFAGELDVTYTTSTGADCPADAEISLNIGDNITVNDTWFAGGIEVPSLLEVVSDSCTDAKDLTITVTDKTKVSDGCMSTLTITFAAADACGNSAGGFTCKYIFIDDEAPEVINACPTAADFGYSNVQCQSELPTGDEAELAFFANNIPSFFQDACNDLAGVNISNPVLDGTECNGVATYTIDFFDSCGNRTSECTFTIEWNDTTAPEAPQAPADLTVECIDDVPAPGDLTATDNCAGEVTVTGVDSVNSEDACNVIITRTWTFTDACENTSSVSQTITVSDTVAPVAPQAPADLTVECLDDVPAAGDLTATDNCAGEVTVTGVDSVNSEDACNVIITRTWTFTDACENTSSVSQTITVSDTIAPTFDQDTLPADESLECADDVVDAVILTASDNCGNANVAFTEVVGIGQVDCANSFTITRTWTATDSCDNRTVHVQVITVSDETAPVAPEQVPADITVECSEDVPAPALLTATDNCDSKVDGVATDVSNGQTCPEIITRTWTFTDSCGNQSSVSQIITVDDTTAPVIDVCPEGVDYGLVTSEPTDFATTVSASDNCDDQLVINYNDSDSSVFVPGQFFEDPAAVYKFTCQNPGTGVVDFVTFTHDGTFTDVGIGQDKANYNSDIPGYRLEFVLGIERPDGNTTANDWVLYNPDGLVFAVKNSQNNEPAFPDCNANWQETPELAEICKILRVECLGLVINEPGITNFTKVRTFTATDDCDNVSDICTVMYTWSIEEGETTAREAVVSTEKMDFKAYPVPFENEVTIQYMFEYNTSVTIEVFDAKGILVNKNTNNNYKGGTTDNTMFDMSRNSNQMYYVKLTTNRGSITKKILSNK